MRLFAAEGVLVVLALVLAGRIDFGRYWPAQAVGFFFRSIQKNAAAERPVLAAAPPGAQSWDAVALVELGVVAGWSGLTPAA